MFIRGIDFARTNVIVGSDNEAVNPANTQNFKPRGELVARVVGLVGAEATLEVANQRVIVESHIPLNLGDKLWVRVYEGSGGQLRLAVLASGPEDGILPQVADADVDTLLRELGLPADERTRHAARALLARDGTIDKPALARLLADLRQFPTVTAREAGAAALLQKAGTPVTPQAMATILSRAEPHASPQLASRLTALVPALEGARRQLPATSPKATLVDELLRVLTGLPLDEKATAPKVTAALREWMHRLQPPEARAGQARAGASPEGALHKTLSPLPGAPPLPGEAAKALNRLAMPENMQAEAADDALPKQPSGKGEGAAQAPSSEPAKLLGERASRVPASQNVAPRMGITGETQAPGKADLASLLERVSQALGSEHKGLGKLVKEAVAELRYTQLVNGPPPPGAEKPELLVPLLVPQLFREDPEGRLQVFHKPKQAGEAIDPNNVRLVFVLNTEHLGTVQADLTIKEGVVDLVVGVPEIDDRQFLARHLQELTGAIQQLGFPIGRFDTRVAKGQPPKVRQEEGLEEIVRFDRRV